VNSEITKRSATLRQHRSRLPRPSQNGAHLKSKEEAPNYNATTDDALARPAASGWPCTSIKCIKAGQRSRFATSAASSLLSTIHQQLKIHRANLLLNRNLAFTVQEETIVALWRRRSLPPVRSRQRAESPNRPHKRGKRQLPGLGPEEDQHKRRRKSHFTGRWRIV
jgi:hypothetical protein